MIFKRSEIPGEDIRRTMSMADKRRELIQEASAEPLIYEYGVNRLAKSLHPGITKAFLESRQDCGVDSCRITLRSAEGKFPYFRAGQFITLSSRVNDSFLSRPYSIASSPKEALQGKMEIIVQRKGIFSTYLIDDAHLGRILSVSEPSGDFYHDDLRDRKHLLAIAGGSGITPFLSMMKAIKEGSEDFRLTLIYGARTRQHIPFDLQAYDDERIKIIPVLSEEQAEGYGHGFITADLIRDQLDDETSIFLCGPEAMYTFVGTQMDQLGINRSRIRHERNSIGDRIVKHPEVYTLTVHIRDQVYELEARNNETIITAIERAGIPAAVRCRNGVCGFCHSRVISGEYEVTQENDFRRAADKKFNYIHPCCSYPLSDMEIEVPIFNI